ncbi:MAG TPA: UDP-N-acetylmuramoyl-L-alanine--D-glutamate ligase [Blastocatellia bacterium]|nr:UDP-N-acetylmuramoyl-L-alanine--D-glutamate ligase [Blastocatellia bacterium]
MKLARKKVLVVGLARSGVAAARLLVKHGASVIANDARAGDRLADSVAELRAMGAELSLGGHPPDLFAGVDLIVLSPGVPADLPALDRARAAGVEMISEVELASRFLRGRIIGITGSNGKTTTTTLTGELMRALGCDVLVGGNIGTPLTSLAEQATDGTWTVAEFSSFQLETIQSLRVNVAVVTNITPDHLDRHHTFDNYVRAKHRIFLNQSGDDWAILNGQDQAIAEMSRAPGVASKQVWFSSRGPATVAGANADLYARDGHVYTTLPGGAETHVIALDEIPLRGMHNAENVMAAVGATLCATGAPASSIPVLTEAIRLFKGVEHRMELVTAIGGVEFFNDSKATNVDSTLKALESFEENLIVILGGKDKDSDYRVLAPVIGERVKLVVLIGAAAEKIAGQLEGVAPMIRAESMEAAVSRAFDAASSGDKVLLAPACASFDMFDNYEHRGRVFKEAVRKLAGSNSVPASARGEFSGRKGELAPAESGATEFSADNVSRGHARLPD